MALAASGTNSLEKFYRARANVRRAMIGRGRERNRGISGGGTLCSGAPQLGQAASSVE
jgi:hypothetical protein